MVVMSHGVIGLGVESTPLREVKASPHSPAVHEPKPRHIREEQRTLGHLTSGRSPGEGEKPSTVDLCDHEL